MLEVRGHCMFADTCCIADGVVYIYGLTRNLNSILRDDRGQVLLLSGPDKQVFLVSTAASPSAPELDVSSRPS